MKKYIFATAVLVLSACQQQQSNFNIDETLDYCSTQVERALVNSGSKQIPDVYLIDYNLLLLSAIVFETFHHKS